MTRYQTLLLPGAAKMPMPSGVPSSRVRMGPLRGMGSCLTVGDTCSAARSADARDGAASCCAAGCFDQRRHRLLKASGRVARYKFMEAADFAVLGFILVQKCQAGLVKFLEELVPADLLQTLFLRAEIDAEDSRMSLLFGRFHRRRDAVPFLCPFLDFLMVCGGVAFAH